ncbi:MAG TPA: hypothetical protein VGG45_11895 [Terracidiphilus sp.]|jgi:hypothetical protein
MLLAAELIIALLLGFVLGRVWEIRRRIVVAETIDKPSRPIEIRAAAKVSQQVPREDSKRLAALDREMQDLIRTVASQGRRPNTADRGTGRLGLTPYAKNP